MRDCKRKRVHVGQHVAAVFGKRPVQRDHDRELGLRDVVVELDHQRDHDFGQSLLVRRTRYLERRRPEQFLDVKVDVQYHLDCEQLLHVNAVAYKLAESSHVALFEVPADVSGSGQLLFERS